MEELCRPLVALEGSVEGKVLKRFSPKTTQAYVKSLHIILGILGTKDAGRYRHEVAKDCI